MGLRESKPTIESTEKIYDVMLCMGTSCISSGAEEVKQALMEEIKKHGLEEKVTVREKHCSDNNTENFDRSKVDIVETGCNGFCAAGPIMVVYPGGIFYQKVTPDDAKAIVESHFQNDNPVERLLFQSADQDKPVKKLSDIPFFAKQKLKVLRNKGRIAAECIDEYIGRDGYQALAKTLYSMTPQQVVDEIKAAGLRGRGGAGFPTGLKWQFCANSESDKKYIVCNADEGDPGAFMDRSLLESDPHAVLEGMMIGARAIGADEGYIYCRAEYPLALHRLEIAIKQARERGLLGKKIMGTDFNFDISIAQGSGAFVCGEETALLHSIEGKRGEPRPRPPFPAQSGLWGKPTVLNNVETLGNIALIIREGAKEFKKLGTENSPGTKIFALTGNLNNIGLIEVPIGTSLGEIIYDIGDGVPDGKEFKAAQIGGPSGGCIPKEHLNVPIDYESLQKLGAIMGSGGLVVMDDNTCMADVARFFLEFTQEEACGKCSSGRVGTKRLLEILERICGGQGEEGDIDKLVELCSLIKKTALCGLCKTAPNPVLATLRYFKDEYEDHIREKKCRVGVCASLVRAPCQSACPAGVDVPGFVSLVAEKRYAEALKLHRERNPFAAACARVCYHTCESRCRRATLDEPLSIRGIKRFMVDQEVTIQIPDVHENAANAKKKIVIIGGGPSGLSCAYFLARLGYKPKVFESQLRPGGMLVQAIPAYRLPREILAREVRMIENLGVDIETDKKLGRDFTLEQLKKEGYEAVYVATGAPVSIKLGLDGEEANGVTQALDFLRQYNVRGSVPIANKVIIIGGGNAAVDASRTALRLGAENVTLIYRRTREQMPAYEEEIEEAEHEGVKLMMLTSPVEIVQKDGKVTAIRCRKNKLGEFDRSGRRRANASDELFELECGQVIAAISQASDAPNFLGDFDLELNDKGYIKANPLSGKTSVDWIFAGGDVVTGPWSVIEAVAAGEKGATGIDEFLTGECHAFWRQEADLDTYFDPDADPVPYPREKQPLMSVERRRNNFDEVEKSWSEAVAVRQAKRCLRCDYGKQSGK
ncbi:MAG: FAD-dependent oxidoreductase [Lentisphaerae bacterium]|nr:FAD-dependent oxidoreductase [Lentisphaerota bacterium]MCP4103890.1 FAD-dependent oxidoreductase [Lentisphaerota bacterium]